MEDKYLNLLHLPTTEDVKQALYKEGVHDHIKVTGHELPQQGTNYIEIKNALFICDKDYIIDVPEYENLADGNWYIINYEPRMFYTVQKAIEKLAEDKNTRQAIINLWDDDDYNKSDMICTMYISLSLEEYKNFLSLTYTVHMRSSDVREFRSDLKFHKKVLMSIVNELNKYYITKQVIANPIIWYADSLQCWDKDWEALKK